MVKVKVIYDYDATQPDELTIKIGDIISDVKKLPGGWWEGGIGSRRGVFPDNFVEDYTPPANELPKGPKPGGGKISELQSKLEGQIKLDQPPLVKSSKPKQMAVVLFEYRPEQPDELELMEGDTVEIIKMAEEGWWEGVLRGKSGMFPSNFVKLLDTPQQSVAYPPGGSTKQNDVVHRAATGGRPPAEKPKMPLPVANTESSIPPPQLPKRNRGVKAKVIYSYHALNEDELTLGEGQIVLVTDQKLEDPGWWRGELNGRAGVFPDNFVELIQDDEPSQPAPGQRQQQQLRGAAPRGPSVRSKPPPQPPAEVEPPAVLPPRPKQEFPDSGRGALLPGAFPPSKPVIKPEPELPKPSPHPMVNGVDDKTASLLREEMDKLKSSMVSRESYELLQREVNGSTAALDSYKRESNKKLVDLMKEIDEVKKQNSQINVELTRIRKLAEDQWASK